VFNTNAWEIRMKSILLVASIAAAALCAGCADTDFGYGRNTNAMGAGPGTHCRDGVVLPPNSRCALHGGVVGGPRVAPGQATGG
jgi:hypothetical protein